MADHPETPLAGGNINAVVRVGDTVRRPCGPQSATVHRFLRHLERQGFTQAPRFLGIDERGREILSFVEGSPDIPPDLWTSDAALVAAAQMLSAYHAASVGFKGGDDRWAWSDPDPSRHEVICHNDFAPYNMIFDDGVPCTIVDIDLCGPGARIRDVAYLAYWLVPLSFAATDLSGHARRELAAGCPRLRQICSICATPDQVRLLDTVSEVLHGMGDPHHVAAMVGGAALKLERDGHLAHWRREARAFDTERPRIEAAIAWG